MGTDDALSFAPRNLERPFPHKVDPLADPGDRRYALGSRGLIVLFTLYLLGSSVVPSWKNPITWDAFGYHLYLPLSIVHHDLGMRDPAIIEGMFATYEPSSTFYQAHKAPTGDMVIRYSPGVALLDLPAFLIAHTLAGPLGFPADGLSRPYQYAAMVIYIVYLTIGLWALLRILELLFSARIAVITLAVFLVGTNLLIQFERSCLLTHGYSFMLFSLLLLCTISWHRAPTTSGSIALGGILGLITLLRPTDALAVLIPVLWPLRGTTTFPAKLSAIWRSYRAQVLITIVAAMVCFFPLPLYWKIHAGSWIYDSYQNPGEGLDLLYPHTLKFLFSFRKGWFLYTPMMILACAGFMPLFKRSRDIAIALLAFLIIDLYVVSSWTVWYYPGGFGQRAMVQAYPVMAIAFAALLSRSMEWDRARRRLAIIAIVLFAVLNLHQTGQYRLKVFDPVRMTPAYYAAGFFDLAPDPAKQHLLLLDRPTSEVRHADLSHGYAPHASWRLEENDAIIPAPQGREAWRLDDEHPFTPAIEARYDEATSMDHGWLRMSAMVYCDSSWTRSNTVLVAHFEHGGTYGYQTFPIASEPGLLRGQWNKVVFDYLTPEPRRTSDRFKIYAWHIGGGPVWIDDLAVTSFIER